MLQDKKEILLKCKEWENQNKPLLLTYIGEVLGYSIDILPIAKARGF
ncbi:hypothetical protein JT198_08090 [Helicobacter pylori]|nr:hypothetical protein [Helicobacter pylori]